MERVRVGRYVRVSLSITAYRVFGTWIARKPSDRSETVPTVGGVPDGKPAPVFGGTLCGYGDDAAMHVQSATKEPPKAAGAFAVRSGRPRAVSFEDHAFVGEWLSQRLDLAGIEHAANVSDPLEFIPCVREADAPLAIIDVMVPGADPFAASGELSGNGGVTVVFLSASCTRQHVTDALRAGASGYFGKMDEPASIVEGLRSIAGGRAAFGERAIEAAPEVKPYIGRPIVELRGISIEAGGKVGALTEREREVLSLIGQGLSRAEIAKALSRSPKTIDKHRGSLMAKLDIHDRAQLVLFAVRNGMVNPQEG